MYQTRNRIIIKHRTLDKSKFSKWALCTTPRQSPVPQSRHSRRCVSELPGCTNPQGYMGWVNKKLEETWNNFRTREVTFTLPLLWAEVKRGTARLTTPLSFRTNSPASVCLQESGPVQTWHDCDDFAAVQGSWQTLTTMILNASPDFVPLCCLLYSAKARWKASNIQPLRNRWCG